MKKNKNKNKKIDKRKEKIDRILLSHRLIVLSVFILAILGLLILRLAFIQFVSGSEYKEAAYRQQTINKIISPKRGTIYDATGKALAMSADVDTISINPSLIKVKHSDPEVAEIKTKLRKEKVATALSEIFELDYEAMLEKVNSTSSVETIIKKVEQDKVDLLKQWMEENEIYAGINIDNDTKRYYPYNNFASNLLGFCGDDNQGLEGLEARLDKVLTGTPGKMVTSGDSGQQEIPNTSQLYIVAENGSDVVLSLDYTIQSIAEKYLKQAVEESECNRGGNVIIMKPDTGDVLAMATYPDYNLNSPFTPTSEKVLETWNDMASEDRRNYLYNSWRNIAVTDGYEPGSTFKIITSAIAIEEGLADTDTASDFLCTGSQQVSDREIKCWRWERPHGYESLRNALCNSCNPAFIQLAQRIGTRTFYKYLSAFGLRSATGAEVSGEFTGLFHPENTVGEVELATLSFGQRFTISPLQLITAISSIANNGVLMKPRIVKQIINSDTKAVTSIEPQPIREVLSTETCNKVKSMLQSVVTVGTGKYAAVEGYTIGGKTGTSEPSPSNPGAGYVASYIAVSPIDDPQVVVLVTLYDPQGSSHEGGQIAAPVISQIMSEVLPYLGLAPEGDDTHSEKYVTVPDIRNKTVTEAIKNLEKLGFSVRVDKAGDNNTRLVTDQTPKPGTRLLENSIVALYTETNSARTSVNVPNLKNKTLNEAKESLRSRNLNISYEGKGKVISQDIMADSPVEIGTVIKITLKEQIRDTY